MRKLSKWITLAVRYLFQIDIEFKCKNVLVFDSQLYVDLPSALSNNSLRCVHCLIPSQVFIRLFTQSVT